MKEEGTGGKFGPSQTPSPTDSNFSENPHRKYFLSTLFIKLSPMFYGNYKILRTTFLGSRFCLREGCHGSVCGSVLEVPKVGPRTYSRGEILEYLQIVKLAWSTRDHVTQGTGKVCRVLAEEMEKYWNPYRY